MRDPSDFWFIRLPDGRVVRVRNTRLARHYIETGRIPSDCWVRRNGDEDWTTLEWTAEFADLVSNPPRPLVHVEEPRPRKTVNGARRPRARAPEMPDAGVRGLVKELLTAMDSSLKRKKLAVAATVTLAVAVLGLAAWFAVPEDWTVLGWFGAGLAALAIVSLATTLITQMTFVELSRLRPAHWNEAGYRLGRFSWRIFFCHLLVDGLILACVFLFVLPAGMDGNGDGLSAVLAVLGLILEMMAVPVLALALLLGPIVIIEECSAYKALAQWLGLVRRHLPRILLYETLAAALGAVMSLPFLLPLLIAVGVYGPTSLAAPTDAALVVLAGLALGPFFCYLIVANVFIYINLRYQLPAGFRD